MTTALYRRYRPETFADVIGQEHVTEPLMQALRTGRVNHAYLFSGPRGCGKTTSARILARCLNCEQGPTPTPCGVCDSCVALARGGAGTVDVIEIDAASHGGVDDARDLRERASYGPAQSRYKIYIIDEAHMVTPQGFNALLKIVEEPPEHVKFVFATTEPEKVIGTIRSRTHHYPFRLVPPARLTDYLQQLCDAEGVAVEPGVLSFVTRAGGGSVRDSLSVLDQLIAGSGEEGLTYAGAAALLGFTDGELLDATVDALGAHDSGAVFRQIDRVVESGHDPRRFIEDLLERLRDLIVIAAVPDGAAQVLRGVPEDQLDRMRQQAASFGPGELSRAADIVNTGLSEMTGATGPRLQLELICARVLLPAVSGEQGYAARLDRLERRMDIAPQPGRVAENSGLSRARDEPVSKSDEPRIETPPTPEAGRVAENSGLSTARDEPVSKSAESHPESPTETATPTEPPAPQQDPPQWAQPAASAPAEPEPAQPTASPTGSAVTTDAVRRAWPDVLDRIARSKRVTWTLLSQHAHVADFDGETLTLGTSSPGLASAVERAPHPDVVAAALYDALGVRARVTARADAGAPSPNLPPEPDAPGGQSEPPPADAPPADLPPAYPPASDGPPQQSQQPQSPPTPPANDRPAEPPSAQQSTPQQSSPQRSSEAAPPTARRSRAAEALAQAGLSSSSAGNDTGGGWGSVNAPPPEWATAENPAAPVKSAELSKPKDEEITERMDDEDVDDPGQVGLPVMQAVLGATVIDEQVD
ncbi:MAG TPA: DNA polymerase III subunit gamma and tau [Flexivirga sp.]|uniref:DNA polymerase III subunit gamma and tau n=1 Tax=Flexivirga sp. TaxID=1962927 RepID=UPI002BDA2AB2|nr:DNA polymerase III subunit gamma and tau [Flexivirga sp.]HWC22149.1 DNA polymerase III subunit gamma and tau [Flexivirga sp.]